MPAAPASAPRRVIPPPSMAADCDRSPLLSALAAGAGVQDQRTPRRLAEVELAPEVAELLGVLPDVGARVGAAIGGRVQPLAAEEVVLDELQVRVEAQRLVVDLALTGVRADEQAGDPHAIAE